MISSSLYFPSKVTDSSIILDANSSLLVRDGSVGVRYSWSYNVRQYSSWDAACTGVRFTERKGLSLGLIVIRTTSVDKFTLLEGAVVRAWVWPELYGCVTGLTQATRGVLGGTICGFKFSDSCGRYDWWKDVRDVGVTIDDISWGTLIVVLLSVLVLMYHQPNLTRGLGSERVV